jgi:hypothetical protein
MRCRPILPFLPPYRIFTEPTIQLYSTILLAQIQTQGCLIYFTFTEITLGQLYIQKRRCSFCRKLKLKEAYITHGERLQKISVLPVATVCRELCQHCAAMKIALTHTHTRCRHLDTSFLIFISHLYGMKATNFGTASMHISMQGYGCLYILGLFRAY